MKNPEEYLKELFQEPYNLKEGSIEYDFLQIIKKIQFDTANTVLESLRDKIKSNECTHSVCLSYIYDMQESIDLMLNGEEGRLY
jgi:hypothetical protein